MPTRLPLELLSLYLRRTPWQTGRWRLAPLALNWSRSARLGDYWRTVTTRDGFRMRVALGDWLGRHIYAMGEYEPGTTEAVKALLRPGQTFVDVGANAGYFSLLAASRVGAGGKVIAFEPIPEVREQMLHNLRINGFANVVVREEALADECGAATFFVGPTNHRGTSSLRSLTDSSRELTVQKQRLDDVLPAAQPVDLIKIDVEGAECLALRGMNACLQRHRPDLIVEVTDSFLRAMGNSAAELCGYLSGFGYRMYAIGNDGVTPVDPADGNLHDQFNALFTCRTELPARLCP